MDDDVTRFTAIKGTASARTPGSTRLASLRGTRWPRT